MKLKRTLKRKTKQPNTVVKDFGMNQIIAKIEKAIKVSSNR